VLVHEGVITHFPWKAIDGAGLPLAEFESEKTRERQVSEACTSTEDHSIKKKAAGKTGRPRPKGRTPGFPNSGEPAFPVERAEVRVRKNVRGPFGLFLEWNSPHRGETI